MRTGLIAATVVLVALGSQAAAESAGGTAAYSELRDREIKALSAERVRDLRTGRGAGYALAAELNGYPGPLHVLDLAENLALTPEQRAAVEVLFRAMAAEARPLGARLLERERSLERLFAEGRATPDELRRSVAAAAEAEGALRTTHLRYHIETHRLLTEAQRADYARLRGYSGPSADGEGRGHRHAH
jgi:Spy/CpxP family protein refolding chaperone